MAELGEEGLAELRTALATGDKLRALEIHRRHTGSSITEAKQFVTALIEREQLSVPPWPPRQPRSVINAEGLAALRQALARGAIDAAQALYEQHTGARYFEARQEIASLARDWAATAPVPVELQELAVACWSKGLSPKGPNAQQRARLTRWSEEQRSAAFGLTIGLLHEAEQVVDQCRKQQVEAHQAVRWLLAQRCPGFSDRAYDDALEYGFFATLF